MGFKQLVTALLKGLDPDTGVTGSDICKKRALDVRVLDNNLSTFGEQIIGRRTHDISVAFNYNISSHDITTTTTGTGASAYDNSTATISPGTGIGFSSIESHNTVAYRPGSEGFAMFTAAFDNGGESGLIQSAGLMDTDNGFWLGYNGVEFSVAKRKQTVDSIIPLSSFNGADISWLDPTKLNIYMIKYGWLGIAPITFWVYDGSVRDWILMHAIDLTNKQTYTHTNTPTLPIYFSTKRVSGSGTAAIIRTASWRGGIVDGGSQDFHRHFSASNTKAGVTSTLTNIFTIRNKSTFQSVSNKVFAELEVISCASDGTKPVEIQIIKSATLGGTPSWSDKDTNNSVMEIDTAGTTVTGGHLVFTLYLGKIESTVQSLIDYNFLWHPGETITLAAKTVSGTSDISFAANWGEIF